MEMIIKMGKIIVDPVLEAVCLPLAEDEFNLLESQILRDGCLDALKVWDREGELVLLDGHNRMKICKKHNMPYDTSTIEIESAEDAIIWIVDNQKGRRNIATDEQKYYISGKRYEAQKIINRRRDDRGLFTPSVENLPVDSRSQHPTADKIGTDMGISDFTVRQNEKFAKGVDAVREVSPELAEKILKPNPSAPKLTKGAVAALPKLKETNPNKFIETVTELEEALDTKDKKVIEVVVRDHIKPDEPTHDEKMIAKKHNLKPEHVRYANEHNIPYENLKTLDQIEIENARGPKSCSNIWDGIYNCKECEAKFELFGAAIAPRWCPLCGKSDVLERM